MKACQSCFDEWVCLVFSRSCLKRHRYGVLIVESVQELTVTTLLIYIYIYHGADTASLFTDNSRITLDSRFNSESQRVKDPTSIHPPPESSR